MKWEEPDEKQLQERKEMRISIDDTALGRHRKTMKRQLLSSVATMTQEELESLRKEIATFEEAPMPTTTNATLGDLAFAADAMEIVDGEMV